MSKKPNRTGRNKGSLTSFVGLERYLLSCPAWRSLKPIARAAYIEVCFHYDGTNNGSIQMGARALGDRLNVNKATASRAIKQLIDAGFVEIAKGSAFSLKSKQVSEYRLAAFRCDVTGALPTKAFMNWVPEIQNTVAPTHLYGCTSATESQKKVPKTPLQLHQRNHSTPKPTVHGCTSAPPLYSTMGGVEKLGAVAPLQEGGEPQPRHTVSASIDDLTPLQDVIDLSKLFPNKFWPASQAA